MYIYKLKTTKVEVIIFFKLQLLHNNFFFLCNNSRQTGANFGGHMINRVEADLEHLEELEWLVPDPNKGVRPEKVGCRL